MLRVDRRCDQVDQGVEVGDGAQGETPLYVPRFRFPLVALRNANFSKFNANGPGLNAYKRINVSRICEIVQCVASFSSNTASEYGLVGVVVLVLGLIEMVKRFWWRVWWTIREGIRLAG